jgi:hypothetical protein
MNKPYHNDQADIAESFCYLDDHTIQTARLAFFKINSYKLSLIHAAFCMSRQELTDALNSTLFNYKPSSEILCDLGFFEMEMDN